MERTVSEYIGICHWDTAKYFIFSDNVFGTLVYYSHLLPLVVSLLFALFVFSKNSKLLATRWLLVTTLLLGVWLFSDLVLWANEKPSLIMFFWSLQVLIEPIIYAGVLFFVYALVDGKDISFRKKIIAFILLFPTIILASTNFALTTYDLTNCRREAIEGPLASYGYAIEIFFALWILGFGLLRFFQYKNTVEKKKVVLVTAGAVFFLLSFAMGNVVGSLLMNWRIGQYGLFGVPVFVAVLSYLIVKYNAFSVKLIATQILITTLCVLTFGILFLRQISTVRIVVSITFVFFTVLGYLLIKSVQREIAQRERIEKLAAELETANAGQVSLMHSMNHQVKGKLGNNRIVFDELLHNSAYSAVLNTTGVKKLLEQGTQDAIAGIDYVQRILRSASARNGTLPYDMKPMDLKALVAELAAKEKVIASEKVIGETKGLSFETHIADGNYAMTGDAAQLGEALRDLVENAIKYNSPNGSVVVTLLRKKDTIVFGVKDTGVGISKETETRLYKPGGMGEDSMKYNTDAAGFGLAFVKPVIEKHGGKIWHEPNSSGRGTTFFVELPVKSELP